MKKHNSAAATALTIGGGNSAVAAAASAFSAATVVTGSSGGGSGGGGLAAPHAPARRSSAPDDHGLNLTVPGTGSIVSIYVHSLTGHSTYIYNPSSMHFTEHNNIMYVTELKILRSFPSPFQTDGNL